MKTQTWKRLCLGLVAALLLSLSGCELLYVVDPEAAWMAEEFFDEWMASKDMSPTNENGGVDPAGAAKLGKRLLTDSTGNEESDAALDRDWIANIAEADQLMDDGRSYRDAEKMAEAIKKRPDDYTYRASAAVLAAEQGDALGWNFQEDAGRQLADKPGDQVRWADQMIAEAETSIARVTGNGTKPFKDGVQCELLYRSLSSAYSYRYQATGSANLSDRDLGNQYYNQSKDDCYKK